MENTILKLRKELNLTQEEFAKKINISRANLGSIEIGRTRLTNRVISDICREFKASETWLRTGEGEMFIKNNPDNSISKMLTAVNDKQSFQKDLLYAMSQLTEDQWSNLEEIVNTFKDTKK